MREGTEIRRRPQGRSVAGYRLALGLALAGICVLVPAVAWGQDAGGGTVAGGAAVDLPYTEASRFASPFLPPGHWANNAARRLEALGLTPPGFGGGLRSRTLREMAVLFETAVPLAERRAPELAFLARAYRARFADEFEHLVEAVVAGGARPGLNALGGHVAGGYESSRGEVRAGVGYDNATDWTGTAPLESWRGDVTGAYLAIAFAPHVALSFTPMSRDQEWEVDEIHATAMLGPAGIWVGRRSPGFHPGVGGGIVLSEGRTFDGAGIFLDDPVDLPWLLRHLGPFRFELFGTRIENGDRITSPWFAALHLSFQPHPRLEFGVSRADIFGGKGNSPTTLRSVAQMLFGFHAGEDGEYNNEVFSTQLRYRPPVGPLPLLVYLEWGMDDSAGAWRRVPARVMGVEVPALPGIHQVGLGVERTTFGGSCCGNTIWYRNWALRGGWTDQGRPLGHPLGGHGEEWLVFARTDLFDARLMVDLRVFERDRGEENLFAPEREGRSSGAGLTLEGRIRSKIGVFFHGVIEDGRSGWRQSAVRVGARLSF